MADISHKFRPLLIPVDKKFPIHIRTLPHQDGPDDAARGVQNEGTGMEPDEEDV